MNFQNALQTVLEAKEIGKTVLVHCNNWNEIIWVAFKKDEHGNDICTIFMKKENGNFFPVVGARFKSFEIQDLLGEWETVCL